METPQPVIEKATSSQDVPNVLLQKKMVAMVTALAAAQLTKLSPALGDWFTANAQDILSLVLIMNGVNWKAAGTKIFSVNKTF